MKMKSGFVFLTAFFLATQGLGASQLTNPFGSGGNPTPAAATDPNIAVPRGYIIPSIEEVQGGYKITVEIFHAFMNRSVTLWLQAAINDGKVPTNNWQNPNAQVVNLKLLSDKVIDNPTNFYSKREFFVTADEINQIFKTKAPNAPQIQISAATPLFVYAQFDGGHQWGGIERGGVIYIPGTSQVQTPTNPQVAQSRPTALDLAYNIPQALANVYNSRGQNPRGLQVGGQIRSRVEAEGKYQIPLSDFDKVRAELFKIANDTAYANTILGSDWTIKVEDRYMKRDMSTARMKHNPKTGKAEPDPSTAKLILDSSGYPIPDPMQDTYYDNKTNDAAKNDAAFRYRFTAGNNSGSWNVKPGLTKRTANGIVYRREYGVDTTDDQPDAIAKFADSDHPLNPFQTLREVIPNAKPSEFLLPAAKLTDDRYKFLLQHKTGVIIEVSLDNVHVKSLRDGASARFIQMEMDIDHLATKSTNVAQTGGSLQYQLSGHSNTDAFLASLDSNAFFEGRPVMHNNQDMEPTSPLMQTHKPEFDVSEVAIVALRNHLLGSNFIAGPQKYALAAYAIGALDAEEASKSVKELLSVMKESDIIGKVSQTCGGLFK